MTNNKMAVYATNITNMIVSNGQRFTADEVRALDEMRSFFFNLSDLFGGPVIVSGQVQMEMGQGLPAGRVVEMATPATPFTQAPAAPGAVMVSSGVAPQVEGCIAAQPSTIMQQAAQQRLNQLLAEETAKKAAVQEQFNQGIAQAKAQDDLTASLVAQMQQTAPVIPVTQELVQQAAQIPEAKEMTLAEFVASQQAQVTPSPASAPAQEVSAPAGEMTLEQFVKSQQAKPAVNLQEQLNAELAAQQSLSQPAPGATSPLA